ncbi:hypothetical protein N9400_02595 [Candidatus Thioglobus sp.]|nr:hypothetical protein [Candidatus Thioglobus sp.]
MINVIFTGLIRTDNRFKNSINDLLELRKKGLINQIILSTWIDELDNYQGLKGFLKNNNIQILESVPPSSCKGSFLHQSRSLHLGLDAIKDRDLMIFKTRADLYVEKIYLEKILNLDLNISIHLSHVFEKRVWLPWFEITKPFYLADECFLATYNDSKKLVNYNMIYDVHYNIDSGVSHIRRFVEPFLPVYPIFEVYLNYLGTTAHGTNLRFKVLNELVNDEDYRKFLKLYYFVIKNYFYIGLDDATNYIHFRKWSKSVFELPNSVEEAFDEKYSWDKSLGHIYSTNNKWINAVAGECNVDFSVDIHKLKELSSFAINEKNKAKKQRGFLSILLKIKNIFK